MSQFTRTFFLQKDNKKGWVSCVWKRNCNEIKISKTFRQFYHLMDLRSVLEFWKPCLMEFTIQTTAENWKTSNYWCTLVRLCCRLLNSHPKIHASLMLGDSLHAHVNFFTAHPLLLVAGSRLAAIWKSQPRNILANFLCREQLIYPIPWPPTAVQICLS